MALRNMRGCMERIDRMSISEQVKALRDTAGAYKHNGLSLILREAADTIECLSANLQAENMERSTGDYVMDKKELRSCIVNIAEVTEKYRVAGNSVIQTRIVNKAETYKGYFHTWAHESYVTNGFIAGTTAGQISTLYGIVEYEDGTIHKVPPECIAFTDRKIEPCHET